MNSIVKHGLLVSLALAGVACGSGGGGTGGTTGPAKPATLELDTWWTTAADLTPISDVIALHHAGHPNITVNVVSAASQGEMDKAVTNRFTNGNPPAALQANLGGNALQFGSSALEIKKPTWASAFNPAVLGQLTTSSGKLIGVPLGLTRQNAAYWNKKVLDTLPAPLNTVPVGLDAFKTWLAGAVAAGYTHPLCFGFKDAWVNAHILFEDVLPAVAGADYSAKYWGGKVGTDYSGVDAAMDFAATYLFPYLTPDSATMKMGQGVDRLMAAQTDPSQQCIMTAMGDWGGAQLQKAPDSFKAVDPATGMGDFYGTGFPGAEDLVDFGGDAMVAAQGTGDEADILALFDTFASQDGQIVFATGKNEMPARIDLTDKQLALLPPLIQVNVAALKKSALPGYKVIGKSAYDYAGLATQAQGFFTSGDKTALVAFATSNYPNLM